MINFHGRFAWYELITTEAEAAKAFYSKVMGWGVLDASVPDRAYTVFTAGNDLVGGLMNLPEEGQRTSGKPAWIGYIGVDDVDATAGRIRGLGGTVHVPPTDVINVSRFSIFADPQTARLGLLRWARPPLQKPAGLSTIGQVGWHELLASDWQKGVCFLQRALRLAKRERRHRGNGHLSALLFGRSGDGRNGHQSPSRARSFLALLL